MQNNVSFLVLPEHPCMITRLLDEMREAWRELRTNPRAYLKGAIGDVTTGARRRTLLHLGYAVGILVYAFFFAAILFLWSINHRSIPASQTPFVIVYPPPFFPLAKLPEADDESGGGGGGGRKTIEPASQGILPPFALTDPIVSPRPEETLAPPVLPVIATVKVDPRIEVERDSLTPTGLPDGASLSPSAGPGQDGGMGTGLRGGVGSGIGIGVGPGRDENTGGNDPRIGGRRSPGSQQETVDQRPILLNRPQPFFTELARKNKVQGVVRVKILVDANGAVREVVVLRGLPDGLNEQAIRAAYQMRFRPAMKNGIAVSYWMNNVEVEFNLR